MTNMHCKRPWRAPAAAALVALACGAVLLYIALHSTGWDWPISEFQATIIYSAVVHYHELPLFSYFVNGGAFLLQDPQAIVLSPTTLWIMLFGPLGGLRFGAFFWGVVGCFTFWAWLRRYLAAGAALFAAAAWTLSLGFYWRLVVGNDMFLWHLALPLVLLVTERLLATPCAATALVAGLSMGVIANGPTFHALLYVIVPAALIWNCGGVIAHTATHTRKLRYLARVAWWTLCALSLAALLVLPRLFIWAHVPMNRKIWFDGILPLATALRCVVDPRYTMLIYLDRVGWAGDWGVWESSVALPLVATALACVGLLAGAIMRRRLWLFACLLIAGSLIVTTNLRLYTALFALFKAAFRVPDRCLMLTSFGLAILAGIGAQCLTRVVPHRVAIIALALLIGAVFVRAYWWIAAAQQAATLQPAIALFERPPLTARAGTPSRAVVDYTGRPAFAGNLSLRDFPLAGTEWNDGYYAWMQTLGAPAPVVTSTMPVRAAITHRRVTIFELPTNQEVRVRVLPANFGDRISVTPAAAQVTVYKRRFEMRVRNTGTCTAQTITIAPVMPPPLDFSIGDHCTVNVRVICDTGLIANGAFEVGLQQWAAWGAANASTGAVRGIATWTCAGNRHGVRIENPARRLLGLQQRVPLQSNVIYRLSGTVRSMATTCSDILFGGRVALFLPPQPEQQIVWMSECTAWWPRELIFTNLVTGTATVYFHLGYGNVATTGEFTNIGLEPIGIAE